MFVRKKKNKSGSVSIQIISKNRGKYKVIKTIGCATTVREEELMLLLANTELARLEGKQPLIHKNTLTNLLYIFRLFVSINFEIIDPQNTFICIFTKSGIVGFRSFKAFNFTEFKTYIDAIFWQ